ncbi:MAG: TPR repeat protein [Paracoccaceae bacterium]|jgi:TPR repeat protein
MKIFIPSLIASTTLVFSLSLQPVQARTLDLVFMPPQVEPQNICSPDKAEAKPDDLTVEGDVDVLNDSQRLRFVRRDLRRLMSDDPDHWFDFIVTLLDWQADLDPDLTPLTTLLDKIRLHIDAGRLEQLQDSGLIEQVRQQDLALTSSQRLILAHYYLGGIGVAPDIDYAHELIRIAAFAGNAEALLNVARMEMEGNPVPGWEAPLDMTVTLAFSGMLGQMNASVCRRAERIAREYRNGDVVSANAEVVYAWYKFAADLGGAEAAWRIVEFHLNADAARKDNDVMLHYLGLAIERGITIEEEHIDRLISAGDVDEATVRAILGYNLSADAGRERPSLSPYFQLAVNLDGDTADKDSVQIDYLRELSQFETAPGWVFTALAKEILVRKGRWAAEPEALELLEIATKKDDPEGQQLLAKKLVRQRDDPLQLHRAINLLTDTVSRYGLMSSMGHLETLYRCQANEAPMLTEAEHWATNYRATQDLTVKVSATDLLALDPFHEPLVLAHLQSQALDGRMQSLANFVQRVQVNPWSSDRAHRLWAARVNQSDKALEVFVELEFELATNPAERHLAIELFRRIYLNNGVTTALDLAIALTEDNARDPDIADEIIALLTKAGNRGEGASIKLKARLLSKEQDPIKVYEEFKDIIEERGDFLALMFAIPYVSADKLDDYFDRAVSLMSCGTKAVDELGEAHATHLNPEMSYHWRRIGLTLAGGNALSKLRLSDLQMQAYKDGRSPDAKAIYSRLLAEGEDSATRNLFLLTVNPDLPTYNPEQASEHLLAILARGKPGDESWALRHYRDAVPAVRAIVARKINVDQIYRNAAQSGDARAQLEYGLLLRQTAKTPADLQSSARWLNEAAEAGDVTAMTELGYAMAIGLGGPANPQMALTWLEKAGQVGDERAKELARLVRLGL